MKLFSLLILGALLMGSSTLADSKPIIIAIVDDAFQVDDDYLKGLLWRNPLESSNNSQDDDGNGYIDDVNGWDVSDLDNNVSAPSSRLGEFPHGTSMAKIIASSIRESLGEMDEYPIRIMPVKAISDTAAHLNLVDGYDGLKYAIDNKADLVNLSWGGGIPSKKDIQVLSSAQKNNTIVVASLGTFAQKDASMPAAHPAVIGVAGVNEEGILFSSNFGEEADISASARIIIDGEQLEGVSVSTALVTAAMALMKLKNPEATNQELLQCLQATATPLDEANPARAGKLGAGLLNKTQALECIEKIDLPLIVDNIGHAQPKQPEGVLRYTHSGKEKRATYTWAINPEGRYKGIEINPYIEGRPGKSRLEVVQNDHEAQVIWSGLLSDLPSRLSSSTSNIRAILHADSKRKFSFGAKYATDNIVFSEEFCRGKQEISFNKDSEPYVLKDGSGPSNYAGESDCKWLFKPSAGFNLKFEFLNLDTELNVDGIHLFRGDTTSQTNFLMKVTGEQPPPAVMVERDSVLVWFTSDLHNSGKGFKLKVSQVTP